MRFNLETEMLPQHAKAIKEARQRVRSMDKIDGFKDRHLATIYLAMLAGLNRDMQDCLFDAIVMLEDVCNSEPITKGE